MTKPTDVDLMQDDEFIDLGEASLETEGAPSINVEGGAVLTHQE